MINQTGGIYGGTFVTNKAGITGLSGAAKTISTAASTGLSGFDYAVRGLAFNKTNFSGATVPSNDAGSTTAVEATAATGAAFRPLIAQQAPQGLTTIYPGSVCVFVFGVDKSGNLRVAQGPVTSYSDTSPQSTPLQLPFIPDWMAPFAYAVIKLVSATATTWTFGTSNWNATGVTIDTPVDILCLPATPVLTA